MRNQSLDVRHKLKRKMAVVVGESSGGTPSGEERGDLLSLKQSESGGG